MDECVYRKDRVLQFWRVRSRRLLRGVRIVLDGEKSSGDELGNGEGEGGDAKENAEPV